MMFSQPYRIILTKVIYAYVKERKKERKTPTNDKHTKWKERHEYGETFNYQHISDYLKFTCDTAANNGLKLRVTYSQQGYVLNR